MYIKVFGKKKIINQANALNIRYNISLRNYHVSPASPFSISKSFFCAFLLLWPNNNNKVITT